MANAKPRTRSSRVIALLSRTNSVTLNEVYRATNWEQSSFRAFLAGLRKRGYVLARKHLCDDTTSYSIAQTPAQKTELAAS